MRFLHVRRAFVLILAVAGLEGCTSGAVLRPVAFPGAPAPAEDTSSLVRHSAGAGEAITRAALALVGAAYRFGGEDPVTGVDCSGLVRFVFQQHQLPMPRTVAEQAQVGRRVRLEEVQPGDLIFFSTTGPGATHVGIALGTPGQFVHAPGTGGAVRVERYDVKYWQDRLVDVRRVTPTRPAA